MTYTTIDLTLRHKQGDSYLASLYAHSPKYDADPSTDRPVNLNYTTLLRLALDPHSYGRALTAMLFADADLQRAWIQVIGFGQGQTSPLRLRLRLDPHDERLHALRWETLCDPSSDIPVCTNEQILFSRYLGNTNLREIQLPHRPALRALVMVANPTDLESHQLAPVDVDDEVARCRAALNDVPITFLGDTGTGQHATLNALITTLRDDYHILYLVCHGRQVRDGTTHLWFEHEDGTSDVVAGPTLVKSIQNLTNHPLLIVLAACQSAGTSHDQGILAALGSDLARAGIAAVLAMQGNVMMQTIKQILPVFFREVCRDGQVDRALAAARAAIQHDNDWWLPVLFLRVRDGRLWQEEARAAETDTNIGTVTIADHAIIRGPVIAVNKGTVNYQYVNQNYNTDNILNEIRNKPFVFTSVIQNHLTCFVGREEELRRCTDRLISDHLVVITGMPGVGKTALAAALAHRSVTLDTPDLICWYTCLSREGFVGLMNALAEFLVQHGQDRLRHLLSSSQYQDHRYMPSTSVLIHCFLDLIDKKGYVICFDDFHLVDQDEQVTNFIRQVRKKLHDSGTTMIIISRHIPSCVQTSDVEHLKGLGEVDTRNLLERKNITLDDELFQLLYKKTEGNAQLLELAITSLQQHDKPATLINDLARTDNVERYLIQTVDVGLQPTEQHVMRILAMLLEYGGTRDAIEFLLDGESVRKSLRVLCDLSLLTSSNTLNRKIYQQHATVRDFYYDELSKFERKEMHVKAGNYYQNEELDPLKSATHFFRACDYERAAKLATTHVQAIINQGQSYALGALLAEFAPDHVTPAVWITICTTYGEISAFLGEFSRARSLVKQAIVQGEMLVSTNEQREAQASRYRLLALIDERTGQYEQAEVACRQGLALIDTVQRPHMELARLHTQLAEVLWRQSKYDAAEYECFNGQAALPSEVEAPVEHAQLLLRLATIDDAHGRYTQAIEKLQHGLELSQHANNRKLQAAILNNLGICLDALGRSKEALAQYSESTEIKEQIGDIDGAVDTLINQGVIYLAHGQYDRALHAHTEARSIAEKYAMPLPLALAIMNTGVIHFLQGDLDDAASHLNDALARFQSLDDTYGECDCSYRLGDIALQNGDADVAFAHGEKALRLARNIDSPALETCALRVVGEALLLQGRVSAAATYLSESQRVDAQVGEPFDRTLLFAALTQLALVHGNRRQAQEYVEAGLVLAKDHRLPYQIRLLVRLKAKVHEGDTSC
jgi:tetratricopeptide (TPR) repeat protein